MKKLFPVLLLMLLPQLGTFASAACAGRESVESAFGRSTFVFSGRVVWLDQVIARIQVDKVWKGEERSEIVMRTGAVVTESAIMMTSELLNYAVGRQYVVYASGPLDQLQSPGCARSDVLNESEVAALDKIVAHRKIGTEIHRCPGVTAAETSELRVILSSSSRIPQKGTRLTLDGSTKHEGAQSGDGGRVSFLELPAGEFKLTADLPGFTPKQATMSIPEKSCMEAEIYLSPLK